MKIVVVGGTGLIGSKVVARLTSAGHEAVAASPNSGVDTLTGAGLDEVLAGASVVVDVSNSPSFEDEAVLEFFTTSTNNQLAAEGRTGVGHHVAVSVVGSEELPESGYLRAKVVQERLIKDSGMPFSLVHATQFFEFSTSIAQAATVDGEVRLPPVRYQPIAADDVARVVAEVAVQQPLDGTLSIAGPEQFQFDEFIGRVLAEAGDERKVVGDPHARYFGTELQDRSLVPGDDARLGEIDYVTWRASQGG